MKHVLLIEDERDHAVLIQRALADGYRTTHVETLAAGRALAGRDAARFGVGGLSSARRQRR